MNQTRIVDSAAFAIVLRDEIHAIPLLNLVVELLPGYLGISFGGNIVVILHGKLGATRRHCRLIPCALVGFPSLPVREKRQGFAIPSDTSETSLICVNIVWGSIDDETQNAF